MRRIVKVWTGRHLSWLAMGLALCATLTAVWAQEAPADGGEAETAAEAARKGAEKQASFADGLYTRGFYAMAAAEYAKLAKEFPDDERTPDAYLLWAECYRRTEPPEPARAEAIYRELLQKYPRSEAAQSALLSAAELLVTTGNFAAARDLLAGRQADTLAPAKREAYHYYLGTALNRLGESEKALAELAQVPRDAFSETEHPYRPYAQLTSALISRARGELPAAQALLRGLTTGQGVPPGVLEEAMFHLAELTFAQLNAGGGVVDYAPAVALYRQFLERFPQSPFARQARINLAWALLQTGAYGDLVTLFDEAKIVTPAAEELYLQGLAMQREADRLKVAEAGGHLDFYRRALKLQLALIDAYPQSEYLSYAQLGAVECMVALAPPYADAIAAAESYLRPDGQHRFAISLYRLLGQLYLETDNYPEVVRVYSLLLERFGAELTPPETESYLRVLAAACERIGEPARAAATYRRILALPAATEKLTVLLLAAENSMKVGTPDAYGQAYGDFAQLIRDYPESDHVPLALMSMAEVKMRLDEPAEAIALLTQLLERPGEHPFRRMAGYLRGSLHVRQGNIAAAIADLRASLAGTEPFAEREMARLYLAYALWETDDPQQVSEALNIFAELLDMEAMQPHFTLPMLKAIGRQGLELASFRAAEKAYSLVAASPAAEDKLAGLIGLGKLKMDLGEYQQAMEILSNARKLAKVRSEPYMIVTVHLAETFRQLGDLDRAGLEFAEASKGGTADPVASALLSLGLAKINFARAQNQAKDSAKYRELIDEALRMAQFAYIMHPKAPRQAAEATALSCAILYEQSEALQAEGQADTAERKLVEALRTYEELKRKHAKRIEPLKQDLTYRPALEKLQTLSAAREAGAKERN